MLYHSESRLISLTGWDGFLRNFVVLCSLITLSQCLLSAGTRTQMNSTVNCSRDLTKCWANDVEFGWICGMWVWKRHLLQTSNATMKDWGYIDWNHCIHECFNNSIDRNTDNTFLFRLGNTATKKRKNLFTLIIKISIVFALAIIKSTDRAGSVFLSRFSINLLAFIYSECYMISRDWNRERII